MKKLILLLSFFSTIVNAQYKLPVAPGCEESDNKAYLITCFNKFTKDLSEKYFHLRMNLDEFFRLSNLIENAYFQINTEGKYVYKPKSENSILFNKLASDFFDFNNKYLQDNVLEITPVRLEDGKKANIGFNMPLNFVLNENLKTDVHKSPIIFSENNFIVRLEKDYVFKIYDQNNQLVETYTEVQDLLSDARINSITTVPKNLIVQKSEKGKVIKIEIENLFVNVNKKFKIIYSENDVVIKEFKNMKDFINSKYSSYIY